MLTREQLASGREGKEGGHFGLSHQQHVHGAKQTKPNQNKNQQKTKNRKENTLTLSRLQVVGSSTEPPCVRAGAGTGTGTGEVLGGQSLSLAQGQWESPQNWATRADLSC